MLPAGTVLGSTYTIENFLGGGAYGDVYRVTHRFLGVQAMKILRKDPLSPDPAQLLGGPRAVVKLGDFGLAGRFHPDRQMLRAAGTIHYMPREAAWGFASEKGDVYSVALLLYELLTGVSAFASSRAPAESTAVQLRESL